MKRVFSIVAVCVGVVGLTAWVPVLAGPYVGASFGQASSDVAISDIGDGSGLTGSVDDSDTCWKIYGGWKFMKFFALEAAWSDLGEVSVDATSDGSGLLYGAGSVAAVTEAEGYSVSTLGTFPVAPNFNVFARVGYMFWDADMTLVNSGLPGGSLAASGDGEDLVMGAGLIYDYKGPGAIRVEYEMMEMEDMDVDSISAGLTFRFK